MLSHVTRIARFKAYLDVCGVCEGDGSSCLNGPKTITQVCDIFNPHMRLCVL